MFAATIASLALLAPQAPTAPAAKAGPMVGHMVYFTLKDRTPAGREKLATSCTKHLEDLDGVVFFAAGTLPEDGFAEVGLNDREWDVALQVVFTSKAAHDAYQKHEKHTKFVDENKATWAKVRVFDSVFMAGKKTGKKVDAR